MENARSATWKYFKVDPDDKNFAICKTCDCHISRGKDPKHYTTSNMRNHLLKKHKNLYGQLLNHWRDLTYYISN